jgi:phage-related protein
MRKFDVLYLDEAEEFLACLDIKVRNKILYNVEKSRSINDPQLFKKLTANIWEFRTLYSGLQYRMLAFWDNRTGAFVVATHVFIKKTDKVPKSEIEKAEFIMRKYFKENNK